SRPSATGTALGHGAAGTMLSASGTETSQLAQPRMGIAFITGNDPGKWPQDPTSQFPLAIGAYWGSVQPFVLPSSNQFPAPTPPALNTAEYAAAYDETKSLGGDGIITPTTRTAEQTQAGMFWAYERTPS